MIHSIDFVIGMRPSTMREIMGLGWEAAGKRKGRGVGGWKKRKGEGGRGEGAAGRKERMDQ